MTEKLTPERAVRLLRAKAAELESTVPRWIDAIPDDEHGDLYRQMAYVAGDIALVCSLLADEIADKEQKKAFIRRAVSASGKP